MRPRRRLLTAALHPGLFHGPQLLRPFLERAGVNFAAGESVSEGVQRIRARVPARRSAEPSDDKDDQPDEQGEKNSMIRLPNSMPPQPLGANVVTNRQATREPEYPRRVFGGNSTQERDP